MRPQLTSIWDLGILEAVIFPALSLSTAKLFQVSTLTENSKSHFKLNRQFQFRGKERIFCEINSHPFWAVNLTKFSCNQCFIFTVSPTYFDEFSVKSPICLLSFFFTTLKVNFMNFLYELFHLSNYIRTYLFVAPISRIFLAERN